MILTKKAGLRAFATLVILCAVGLFFAFKPAKASSGEKVKRSTVYYYNDASTNFSDMKQAVNWGTSQNPDYSCGGSDEIPCSITVPEGSTLQAQLNSFSSVGSLVAAAGNRQ